MTGRFQPRPTRSTGVVDHGGRQVKWYEITLDGHPVAPAIVQAARRLADDVCSTAGESTGVGFGIIHHGAESVWVLLDRWQGDIVSQHTWSAALDAPTDFALVPPGGPTACVWELAVHSHERDAFIRHVLDPAAGPDVEAYLTDLLVEPSPLDGDTRGEGRRGAGARSRER